MHTESTVRHKAVWGWAGGAAILALALAGGAGCGNTDSNSPSFIMVDTLTAQRGCTNDPIANSLQSDVYTLGSPCEDTGAITLRLGLRDPGSIGGAILPGPINYVSVTHYRVIYSRSDGHNTPGVDVPYPIEGGMSFTVLPGANSGTFVLVRAQAKLEAPLRGLIGLGAQAVISTIAEVTVYGTDQANNTVSATGYITVTFADWADPKNIG